jgi:hypothetical protein
MEKYCDIVADATGWVYIIDGVRSACCYPSSHLAMQAARAHMLRTKRPHKAFRRQAPSGEMLPMAMRQQKLESAVSHG